MDREQRRTAGLTRQRTTYVAVREAFQLRLAVTLPQREIICKLGSSERNVHVVRVRCVEGATEAAECRARWKALAASVLLRLALVLTAEGTWKPVYSETDVAAL